MKKYVLSILAATIWISISEFVRNEFLLKSFWTDHYQSMNLVFPSKPLNGAVWGIWSLCFAGVIWFVAKKYTLLQSTFISWIFGFVMMWLVIGNLGVLPFGILVFAIPLSLFESFLAVFIIQKISPSQSLVNQKKNM